MNYIYDILANFNEKIFEFYEWNINDDIIHIRKIPLFKINNNVFMDIKENKIKIEKDVLEKIKDKTELFTNKKMLNLNYSCLFTNSVEVIGVIFNSEGDSLYKSKLLLDEEFEVTEICDRIMITKIEYKALGKIKDDVFKTRQEKDIDQYIKEQIRILDINNDVEKLRYIYYECFNSKENNKKQIIDKIYFELNNNWSKISFKLYNFFKLISINR